MLPASDKNNQRLDILTLATMIKQYTVYSWIKPTLVLEKPIKFKKIHYYRDSRIKHYTNLNASLPKYLLIRKNKKTIYVVFE
ncbi:hypothetical protein C0208_08395 [Moraxella catarrhalis]|nr:hypothetical protein [Moraxella catarrhalis]OBX43993.1 hypothetical protein A9Z57_05650 [Moraxella catarrhalis]